MVYQIMEWRDLIETFCESYRVVSVVGAGGKSTLIRWIAEEESRKGRRVLVTTSTHIRRPKRNFAVDLEGALSLWRTGDYVVIGTETTEGKLSAPDEKLYRSLAASADFILIEADGAKGHPCKVPADHEPVIWPETDLVIAVLGMSALGKPLRQCCFRLEELEQNFGVRPDGIFWEEPGQNPGSCLEGSVTKGSEQNRGVLREAFLTEELAAEILASRKGGRKSVGNRPYLVVLNQCDTAERMAQAERIADRLRKKGVAEVMRTCLRENLYPLMENDREKGDCVLISVLDGAYAGEKLFFCGGELRWQSAEAGFLQAHREKWRPHLEIERIRESCSLMEIEGNRIFLERFGGTPRLVICGAGHVSLALLRMALDLGLETTVLDDRPACADQARRLGAQQVICDSFERGLRDLPDRKETYYVIMTRGHRYDRICLEEILGKSYVYAGMMGSRRRVAALKQQLIENGANAERLEQVHMPIGLSIGAETPEEIAVSVLAEIIQCKNRVRRSEGYRKELLEALQKGSSVLAEIVEERGSAPRSVGTKMLIRRDQTTVGTIGGGCVEAEVIRKAVWMLENREDRCLMRLNLTADLSEEEGMVCGGTQLVYLERIGNADEGHR